MQRDIFDDLAWQHLAYEQGGLTALESIGDDDPLAVTRDHLTAWGLVDAGDHDQAVLRFADYEQNVILQPRYDEMLARKPVPWAMTWAMSMTARSPTPSGGCFWQETWQAASVNTPDELTFWPEVFPGPRGAIDTPDEVWLNGFPGEMPPNIAHKADRWEWVEHHMADPIEADLQELAQGRRLIPDLPLIGVDD